MVPNTLALSPCSSSVAGLQGVAVQLAPAHDDGLARLAELLLVLPLHDLAACSAGGAHAAVTGTVESDNAI